MSFFAGEKSLKTISKLPKAWVSANPRTNHSGNAVRRSEQTYEQKTKTIDSTQMPSSNDQYPKNADTNFTNLKAMQRREPTEHHSQGFPFCGNIHVG